jgi:hypothetical protein
MYAFEHSEQGVLSVRTKGSVYSDASVGEDFEADRARSGRSQEDLVAEERVRGLWNDLPYEGFLEAMRIEALQLIREVLYFKGLPIDNFIKFIFFLPLLPLVLGNGTSVRDHYNSREAVHIYRTGSYV